MEKLHSKTLTIQSVGFFKIKLSILEKIIISVQAINVNCFNNASAP
jgi:hypothetical protein